MGRSQNFGTGGHDFDETVEPWFQQPQRVVGVIARLCERTSTVHVQVADEPE